MCEESGALWGRFGSLVRGGLTSLVAWEGTRNALATLVLLDDRRVSGGARGGMFRVVHKDALAVMAIGRAADGSGHPATDQATENGAWGLPSLVLRSGALSPAPHAQPPSGR